MSIKANTAQASVAPLETLIRFKDMKVLQKLTWIVKAFVCICSFGFAFPHTFSDH